MIYYNEGKLESKSENIRKIKLTISSSAVKIRINQAICKINATNIIKSN
jgi:hypothetical protein